MTEEELRKKVFASYKKCLKTEEEPNLWDMVRFVHILSQCLNHPHAKRELGEDVYEFVKRCTKRCKGSTDVSMTEIVNSIGSIE